MLRPSAQRPIRHFQMQQSVLDIGVLTRHRFVEFHPEARRRGWNDITLFPANGSLQEPRMDSAPLLDALQDQKIRRAGGDLNVRGAYHRAAIKMRRDLRSE